MHLWVYECIRAYSICAHIRVCVCIHVCGCTLGSFLYIHFKRSVRVFPRLPRAGSGCRMSGDARLSSNWDDARWSNLCVWVWERERVCLQLQSGYGAAEAHCAHLCVCVLLLLSLWDPVWVLDLESEDIFGKCGRFGQYSLLQAALWVLRLA